jgi:hypothetical protein
MAGAKPAWLAALLLALATPAAAQDWSVHVSVGRSVHELLAADVGTAHLNAEALYGRGRRWGYLGAGAPLATAASPWAGGGYGASPLRSYRRMQIGADFGGHVFAYRDRRLQETGGGAVGEALPVVALRHGGLHVRARAGVRGYTTAQGGERLSRGVLHADAHLGAQLNRALLVEAEMRSVLAEEGVLPFLGAGVQGSHGSVHAWARAGRWFAPALEDVTWSVGVAWLADARTAFRAEARYDGSDPLYWNAPRRSWTVGLARRVGPVPPPVFVGPGGTGPVTIDGGVVTIRVPVSLAAGQLAVAADFTRWQPVPMTREGEHWIARFALQQGIHHFALVDADGRWFVPPGVRTAPDGLGGENAVFVVP